MGDQLLIAFAQRLQNCLRATDAVSRFHVGHTLARLGGDEFTIVLDELSDHAGAVRVAERLTRALREPFYIGGNELHVRVSIGVALNSTGSETSEELLANADTAMYCAKAHGRGRIEVFGPEMRASAMARMQLETELRRALEHGEFQNWYQLIVCLETGQICGLEALVRWNHPTRGLVHPKEFIPVAEELGLIGPIGISVLRDACRDILCLQQIYPSEKPLTVSVNLSCSQFAHPELVQQVSRLPALQPGRGGNADTLHGIACHGRVEVRSCRTRRKVFHPRRPFTPAPLRTILPHADFLFHQPATEVNYVIWNR